MKFINWERKGNFNHKLKTRSKTKPLRLFSYREFCSVSQNPKTRHFNPWSKCVYTANTSVYPKPPNLNCWWFFPFYQDRELSKLKRSTLHKLNLRYGTVLLVPGHFVNKGLAFNNLCTKTNRIIHAEYTWNGREHNVNMKIASPFTLCYEH